VSLVITSMNDNFGIMYDASKPPSIVYPGSIAVGGYLGGNTPHAWTVQEWNNASGNGRLRMLPIWVGYLESDPIGHAKQAAATAINLGWKAFAHNRRYIGLDKETQTDVVWQSAFAAQLSLEGFSCIDYRSLSAIVSDPTPSNADNWVADWDVPPNFNEAPRIEAIQFAANISFASTEVDLSVISKRMFEHLGRGPRK